MENKYAVFIDIDGTLLTDSYDPPQRNLEAIRRVREAGHKVFINTGRSYANIPREITSLNDCFDGFVTGNGSHVLYENKELFSVCMPEQLLNSFCRFFLSAPDRRCLFEGVEDNFTAGGGKWLTNRGIKEIKNANAFSEELKGARISVIAAMGVTKEQCASEFGDEITMYSYGTFFDCVMSGCNKAKAMKIAASAADILPEHTIAIGDSMNDAEMLSCAAVGIAMGNAVDELKAIADYVTDTNFDFGVATALEKFL